VSRNTPEEFKTKESGPRFKIRKFFTDIFDTIFYGDGEIINVKNIPKGAIYRDENFITVSYSGYQIDTDIPNESIFVSRFIGFEPTEFKSFDFGLNFKKDALRFSTNEVNDKEIKNNVICGIVLPDLPSKLFWLDYFRKRVDEIEERYKEAFKNFKNKYIAIFSTLGLGFIFSSYFKTFVTLLLGSWVGWLSLIFIVIGVVFFILFLHRFKWLEDAIEKSKSYRNLLEFSNMKYAHMYDMVIIEWKRNPPTFNFLLPMKKFIKYYERLKQGS